MAHLTPPIHLQRWERYTGFALGLEVDETVYTVRRTGIEVAFTNWARWRGRFVIERLKQVDEYDNNDELKDGVIDPEKQDPQKWVEQDVQTWLDGLQGRKNTTTVPLVEPTIDIPKGWLLTVDDEDTVIKDGLLELTVARTRGTTPAPEAGTSIRAKAGDMVTIGSPPRLYKLWSVASTKWRLTPSIMPKGNDHTPSPATFLKVIILSQTRQYRSKAGRSGWDNVEYAEALT